MGKTAREKLNRILIEHLNTIHETFQVLDHAPDSSLEKVSWEEVIKMGNQVSKQATIAGMLWTGERPEVKELEENMAIYFNTLQGFLLLSHGSKVGAGPTLYSCMHSSVKQVVDSSFMLFKESVSLYGSHNKDQILSIPQLVGTVWEACSALKKSPSTNITAIGRAMTQVAVSLKDVLREIKELKPASMDEASEEASLKKAESESHDSDNLSGGELGNDLSPEDIKFAQLASGVVSDALVVIKELIRSITALLKQENQDKSNDFVNSLERLLKLCQEIGVQVDMLGACLYPPQEFPDMKAAAGKIWSNVQELQAEVDHLKGGSSETLSQACTRLRDSVAQIESELVVGMSDELVPKIEKLDMEG